MPDIITCTPGRLTMWKSGSASLVPMYSTKVAKPSLSHRPSHHAIVTRLPNHYRRREESQAITRTHMSVYGACMYRAYAVFYPRKTFSSWTPDRPLALGYLSFCAFYSDDGDTDNYVEYIVRYVYDCIYISICTDAENPEKVKIREILYSDDCKTDHTFCAE